MVRTVWGTGPSEPSTTRLGNVKTAQRRGARLGRVPPGGQAWMCEAPAEGAAGALRRALSGLSGVLVMGGALQQAMLSLAL